MSILFAITFIADGMSGLMILSIEGGKREPRIRVPLIDLLENKGWKWLRGHCGVHSITL